MNNQFDELAKALGEPVARRLALKKFGVGLAGAALALLGFKSRGATPKPAAYLCCVYARSGRYAAFCVPATAPCPDLSNSGSALVAAREVKNCGQCKATTF